MQVGKGGEHDVVVGLVVVGFADKLIPEIALRAAVAESHVEDVLVPRRIGEEPLIVQIDVRAPAADVHIEQAACARVIVVDVGAPVADARGDRAFPLRHEFPIGECADLDIAEVSGRGDECRTEGVRRS